MIVQKQPQAVLIGCILEREITLVTVYDELDVSHSKTQQ